jgi:hypothetical protein
MLSIIEVKPTVLFTKEKDKLIHLINITIENTQESKIKATLDCNTLKSKLLEDYELTINEGKEDYQIHIPEIKGSIVVKFALKVNGKLQDIFTVNWKPTKHWQVFIVPIAHHDLGYTDTIENVLRKYCLFYEDILKFCKETENWPEESKFRYSVEEAWSIHYFIENSSKETIEKLKKYVSEGRIEVPALFGNEISGLCSHEELIRLMYPSFQIKRALGAQISSASITDIPGLSWGLPKILSDAGVRFFFAGLPTYFRWSRKKIKSAIHTFWDEDKILRQHGRPDAFLWRGQDGGEILVYYQGGYGCWCPPTYMEALKELPIMLKRLEEKGCPFSVVRYGGSGCSDNLPPDIGVSHIVKEWNNKWAFPKLYVSTNTMFFKELQKQCCDIRTFSGELPHTDYAVGAISSAKETGINRNTHSKLHSAEKIATLASLLSSFPSLTKEIRVAYENMMLYDEHTWGHAYQVGHQQDYIWSEKAQYAYKAAYLAESIISQSVKSIANQISLESEKQYIVVFNSLSFKRTDIVSIPKFFIKNPFRLIDDETGVEIAYQIIQLNNPNTPISHSAGRYARGQFDSKELYSLVFIAEEVPSLGYKTYRIEEADSKPTFKSEVVIDNTSLENRYYKVKLNPKTGTIESIYDKDLSRELIDTDAEHELNQLIVRWVKNGKKASPKKANIKIGQAGPIYKSLFVSSQVSGCPQLTQEIILYNKIKRIDFNNRILKDSTPAMEVFIAFPFKIDNPIFHFEGSNSVIQVLRDQFPGSNTNYYSVQNWANATDGEVSITMTSIDSHLVEFGGLWPCYVSQAHHGVTPPDFGKKFVTSDNLTKGHMYSYIINSNFNTNFRATQQDDMLFRYSIITSKGDWKNTHSRDFGWAVSNKLLGVYLKGKENGNLPRSLSFCQVDKPNILILTLKMAEDGDGIIIRLIETEGEDTKATLRLPYSKIKQVYKVNIVEENIDLIKTKHQTVNVDVKAFSITTIRVQIDN